MFRKSGIVRLVLGASLAWSALALCAVQARASLINMQFYNASDGTTPLVMTGNAATGSTDVGSGSTGSTSDFWNSNDTTVNFTNYALKDSTDASTSVTLSTPAGAGYGLYHAGIVTSPSVNTQAPYYADVAPLTAGFLYANVAATVKYTLTLTLNNVTAGNYNLFIYGDSNVSGQAETITADGGSGAAGPVTLTSNATSLTSGTNYTEFASLPVSATGTITMTLESTVLSSGYQAFINGFQLQSATAAPEPASLALLGVGTVGLLARRKRRPRIVEG